MGAWWEIILKQSKDNLYSILCSVGSQWREWSIGVTWVELPTYSVGPCRVTWSDVGRITYLFCGPTRQSAVTKTNTVKKQEKDSSYLQCVGYNVQAHNICQSHMNKSVINYETQCWCAFWSTGLVQRQIHVNISYAKVKHTMNILA